MFVILFLFKPNRQFRSLIALLIVLIPFLIVAGVRSLFPFISFKILTFNLDYIVHVSIGLAVVWLATPFVNAKNRYARRGSNIALLAAAGILMLLAFSQTWRKAQRWDYVMFYTLWGSVVIIGMSMAGALKKSHARGWLLPGMCFLSVFITGMIAAMAHAGLFIAFKTDMYLFARRILTEALWEGLIAGLTLGAAAMITAATKNMGDSYTTRIEHMLQVSPGSREEINMERQDRQDSH